MRLLNAVEFVTDHLELCVLIGLVYINSHHVVTCINNAKQGVFGCKKCEVNQKQHANRQVQSKALI